MALSTNFINQLKQGENFPNTIVEVELDSGTVKWGTGTGEWDDSGEGTIIHYLADGTYLADGSIVASGASRINYKADYSDVLPIITSISSVQGKLDTKKTLSSRGSITIEISGRENFESLIQNNRLKNRKITVKEGFIAKDFAYADYQPTFQNGKITKWERKGDKLTITAQDFLVDAKQKVPAENDDNTQFIDYRDMNPVDIMVDILTIQLSMDDGTGSQGIVDVAQFEAERDRHFQGVTFDRVLVNPKEANKHLDELQTATNLFIFHDGLKVSCKAFAPPPPNTELNNWNDNDNITDTSLKNSSGYDNLINRVIVYYDHDGSTSDGEDNFESILILSDATSEVEWGETATKVIKNKWARTRSWGDSTVAGVQVYHVSNGNSIGSNNYLYFDAFNRTFQWRADGGSLGEAVEVKKSGHYQIKGINEGAYCRITVDITLLPNTDVTEVIQTTNSSGLRHVNVLANQIIRRYRDPASTVSHTINTNNYVNPTNNEPIKLADLVILSTGEAFEFGDADWLSGENVMLTSIRPDFIKGLINIEAIETKIYAVNNYTDISDVATDYDGSTATEKAFGYIGRTSDNKVGAALDNGFKIF